MKPGKLAPLFFVITALGTIVIGWFTLSSLPISSAVSKPLGEAIFIVGMIAFTWTIMYLRKAFLGEVLPVTDHLIIKGPYRWVRHPLYFCMIVALLGMGVAFRSLWGILAVPLVFLPAVIYRVRLEEGALSDRFGNKWDEYVNQTKFLIPFLW
jgi:protein-S-isoprenylcysteine O-methyltransferase Ste14